MRGPRGEPSDRGAAAPARPRGARPRRPPRGAPFGAHDHLLAEPRIPNVTPPVALAAFAAAAIAKIAAPWRPGWPPGSSPRASTSCLFSSPYTPLLSGDWGAAFTISGHRLTSALRARGRASGLPRIPHRLPAPRSAARSRDRLHLAGRARPATRGHGGDNRVLAWNVAGGATGAGRLRRGAPLTMITYSADCPPSGNNDRRKSAIVPDRLIPAGIPAHECPRCVKINQFRAQSEHEFSSSPCRVKCRVPRLEPAPCAGARGRRGW